MVFLILSKHSIGMCLKDDMTLDPHAYIACQAGIFARGLSLDTSPEAHCADTPSQAGLQ
jgi:hypothetical protein